MRLLFKRKYYAVNTGFWTVIKYRLEYEKSIFDITADSDEDYINNLINLLYIAIEGIKPLKEDLIKEAVKPQSYILPFAVELYKKIMKRDKLFDKHINKIKDTKEEKEPESETDDEKNTDFDELTILNLFKRAELPERLLDVASLYQILGIIFECGHYRSENNGTEYKEMNNNDIKAFYGVK